MVLRLKYTSESPGTLIKHRLVSSIQFWDFDSVDLEWGLIVCIFNMLPDVVDAASGAPTSSRTTVDYLCNICHPVYHRLLQALDSSPAFSNSHPTLSLSLVVTVYSASEILNTLCSLCHVLKSFRGSPASKLSLLWAQPICWLMEFHFLLSLCHPANVFQPIWTTQSCRRGSFCLVFVPLHLLFCSNCFSSFFI